MIAGFEDRRGAGSYLSALRQHALIIVGLVAVAVLCAAVYSKTATKRYQSEADVLVSPIDGSDSTFLGFSLLRTSSDPNARPVITAAHFATSDSVATRAAATLHMSKGAALAGVKVTPLSQGNIVSFVGTASSPELAANIANAFAAAFIGKRTAVFQQQLTATIARLRANIAQIPAALRTTSPEALTLQERLGTLVGLKHTGDPTLQLISPAPVPTAAVWPRPVLSVAVAFVAALLLGVGIALALEFVSPRIQREEELLLEHRLPILARVPRLEGPVVNGRLMPGIQLPPDAQESYRTLRASLANAGKNGGFPTSILVTSAIPGEGKTMTSINLAITLARSGSRVVLIDGDLRRPSIGGFFGLALRPGGFSSVLSGATQAPQALVPTPFPRLKLLPAGPDPTLQIDSLRSERVARGLADLRRTCDVIVIDSPPLTEVADALALADAAETTIIAVRLGRSRRDRLVELRRVFALRGVVPAGVVLTTRTPSRPHTYYEAPQPTGEATSAPLLAAKAAAEPATGSTAPAAENGDAARTARPARNRRS